MTPPQTFTGLQIRPYREADEPEVLELLSAALGPGPAGKRSADFFRWKHLRNPFGPSLLLVGEEGGRIVGFRAFMRWRFQAGDQTILAVRPVDTATHPDARGRGVFSRLTREALAALGTSAQLVFNTPNDRSMPGYLKMGWRRVGSITVSVRARRPLRLAVGLRSLRRTGVRPRRDEPQVLAETAAHGLADAAAVSGLLRAVPGSSTRLTTPRSLDYLRWRYASAPLLDYRAVRRDEGGELAGLAIFRVRGRGRVWESTIAELLVRGGDVAVTRRLLSDVVRAADVDLLTCHAPARSATRRGVARSAFLPSPMGMALVVRPIDDDLEPDPTSLGSWGLSLGDLEVF